MLDGHLSLFGALAHGHSGKLSTHKHWKENQDYEKPEAAGKSFFMIRILKNKEKNESNFCQQRIKKTEISGRSQTHCSSRLSTARVHYALDNTGHPCWALSTRVPGHDVLKLRSNCACQEHTHKHTLTHPLTHTHTHTHTHISAKTTYADRKKTEV